MRNPRKYFSVAVLLLAMTCAVRPAIAQVSPDEVTNPELRALESQYLQKLIALNRQISANKFPFPFHLGRYVGVEPKDQPASDSRGLEFVHFHEQTVLKFSGNYNAAFSTRQFTRNQRADRVFSDVLVPVLHMLPSYFADAKDFEAVGFEVAYHVREASSKADYEGKETLVVVLPVADALRFSQLSAAEDRQTVVNAAEVYVSGQRFGLALGKEDALPLDASASAQPTTHAQKSPDTHSLVHPGHSKGLDFRTSSSSPSSAAPGSDANLPDTPAAQHVPAPAGTPAITPAEVDTLQTKYQSALDDFGNQVDSVLHQKAPSSPDLALFRNALYLQLTLSNPETFDKDKTSLYKRAALSFDTFLAPHLSDLLSRLPAIQNLTGLNITVLVKTSANSSASEAVEFICPLSALRSFAGFEITNQDLINQSIVVVNGVRISLNLQQVE
jgi:hypothetical protein